ncbi:hypothetical protein HS088_TW09G00097 [Tripterygium wilfordii]|uniref:Uroporphyrinogen-III synthase n=1 Tax=Tripterygium wilfordii TaxID=458696 RepID=A0A7J7D6Y1_TRIWF|nr:hypothetical protein HS088_TW09G00097 [Tripterygium wilfordii]
MYLGHKFDVTVKITIRAQRTNDRPNTRAEKPDLEKFPAIPLRTYNKHVTGKTINRANNLASMAALRITSIHNHTPIQLPTSSTTATKPTVAFTTPSNYADRLSRLLDLKGHTPLWCPTVVTEPTPQSLYLHLSPHSFPLFSAIAFPSRTAITAFSLATLSLTKPLLPPQGNSLIIAALGKDAEGIDERFLLDICSNVDRVRLLVPPVATPSGMVRSLGDGRGRRVLCPVPLVVGLQEPPVVPNFLQELEEAGWVPVRVNAYETRWSGPSCAESMSLREFGWDWRMVRRRWPSLVVATHGPVTAAGAERLGVDVDVVSSRFDSFDGIVEALDSRLRVS